MNKKLIMFAMGALVVLISLVVTYFIFFSQKASVNKIDFTQKTENIETVIPEDTVKIAIAAMISPKETLGAYEEIVQYVGKKLGKKAEMVQRKTYDEVNELVEKQEVLVALVCAGPYVDGHKKFGMELVAVPQMYGQTVYYSYIIVNKNSPIKSFSELRGKTFAFTDPKSNTGKLVPTYILSKINETPNSFFKSYTYSGSHDNSIDAVAKKLVDGAAIDHLIYKYLLTTNPQFVSETKVIEKHGPFGIPPVVVHPKTDGKLKEQIKQIFLTMHQDMEGKILLNKLMIDKFVEGKDDSYTSVREMEDWIKATQNNSN